MDRFTFPPQFLEYEIDDDIWFCNASCTDVELYRLFEGLEKLTEALKVVPSYSEVLCLEEVCTSFFTDLVI